MYGNVKIIVGVSSPYDSLPLCAEMGPAEAAADYRDKFNAWRSDPARPNWMAAPDVLRHEIQKTEAGYVSVFTAIWQM